MSDIDTSGIDATWPPTGNALTATGRENMEAIKTALDTAKAEIEDIAETAGTAVQPNTSATLRGLNISAANSLTNGAINFYKGGTSSSRVVVFLDTDEETGDNAGSNLRFGRFNDSGAWLDVMATLYRDSGSMHFHRPPHLPNHATAALPSTATYASGSLAYNTTLIRPVYSNGTAWKKLLSEDDASLFVQPSTTASMQGFYFSNDSSYPFMQFRRGGKARWTLAQSTTSETGANAGTDLYLARADDNGASLGNVVVFNRQLGTVQFTDPILPPNLATSSLPTASLRTGGHAYNTTISRPVYSDGSSWHAYLTAPDVAPAANIRNNSGGVITTPSLWSAAAPVDLGNISGTYALPTSTFLAMAKATMTGNVTLGQPTGLKQGHSFMLVLKQDSTGGRTLSLNGTYWETSENAALPIDTGANKRNHLACTVMENGKIFVSLAGKGMS